MNDQQSQLWKLQNQGSPMPAVILVDNHTTDTASVMWLDEPLAEIQKVFLPGQLISVEVLRWLPLWPELAQWPEIAQTLDERVIKNWIISANERRAIAEGYNVETTAEDVTGIRLRHVDINALAAISKLYDLSINGQFHHSQDTLKPYRWSQPTIVDYGIIGRNFWLSVE